MKARYKKLNVLFLLAAAALVSGCNMFEAINDSVSTKTDSAFISEGNDKLAEGKYTEALDLFERAIQKNDSEEARRGRAAANAGLSGFNMFSCLQSLQNEIIAPNSSAAVFRASLAIKDVDKLNAAIEDMWRISSPGKDDLMLRGLMASLSAAKTILVKYDTNLNSKLDAPDQISFTCNDNKTMTWSQLYSRISNSGPFSLEQAYIDLTKAFDGRGSEWVTLSPFNSVRYAGTYTLANKNTISAIGEFGELIKVAGIKFNASEYEFREAIKALDGAN